MLTSAGRTPAVAVAPQLAASTKAASSKKAPRTTPSLLGWSLANANPKNPGVVALAKRLEPVRHADPGCILVTQGHTLLYQSNATEPFSPGSTQKLLIAAAALKVLGPNYTFTTKVMAPAAPVNGVVSSLWLVGGGDPLLEEPAYNAWRNEDPRYRGDPFTDIDTLASLVHAKVNTVTGALHGDDLRYDAMRTSPYWTPGEEDGNVNPLSALTLDDDYAYWLEGPSIVPASPALNAADAFADLLHAKGIRGSDNPNGPDEPPPPGSVVIASIHSPPLSQIIGAMLRPSDNQIAEMLVKELGYQDSGVGTTAAGLKVVRSVDTGLGIPWTGTVMYDGSGLSHDDRTTCRALLAAFYLGDKPGFSELRDGLSVGGVDGTMAYRFTTPPLDGHIRAKTGSIDGVVGMVGEIDVGKPVRFAIVFNQAAPDYVLYDDEDNVVSALAPYP